MLSTNVIHCRCSDAERLRMDENGSKTKYKKGKLLLNMPREYLKRQIA